MINNTFVQLTNYDLAILIRLEKRLS